MTKKKMTKRERTAYEDWKRSEMYELYHAYGSASTAKWNAWEYCKRLCRDMNGEGLKVISKNTFQFTVGFEYPSEETGEIMFAYITANSDTFTPIDSDLF